MSYKIKLNSIDEAVKLVNKLEFHDCNAEVIHDNYILSARSLMGLISAGIGEILTLSFAEELNDRLVEEIGCFAA